MLQHLHTNGPDYTTGIASALCESTGAVSGAVTSLKRKGLVALARTEHAEHGGHPRVIYRAVGPPPPAAPGAALRHAGVELLERLDDDVRLLKFEQLHANDRVDVDVIWCVYGNKGVI